MDINFSAIKSIPDLPFFLLIGILSCFLLFYFIKWYKSITHSRVVADTPTAKIRSAAQGYVELQGKQRFFQGRPTVAFLSKQPCTWYRYTIQQIQKKRWILIEQGSSPYPFQIEDETGSCIIDPSGGQIHSHLVDTWTGFHRHPKGKPSNIFWRIISLFGSFRYQEWRMEQDMNIYAIGNFHTISVDNLSFNSPFFKHRVAELIKSWKKNPKSLAPFDHNHDGKLSKEEWLEVEKAAQEVLLKQMISKDGFIHILSSEGLPKGKPFMISTKEQHKIISGFKTEAVIWLIAYVGLLAGIIWLLVMRFG